MKSVALLFGFFLLCCVNSYAQSRTALDIILDRPAAQVQPNLPDSSFDAVGSFSISDTLNISKLVVSIRKNFQDTTNTAAFTTTDTLYLAQPHAVLSRNGTTVNFSYPGVLGIGYYFFQVDFFDYNQQRIGRTIQQF